MSEGVVMITVDVLEPGKGGDGTWGENRDAGEMLARCWGSTWLLG